MRKVASNWKEKVGHDTLYSMENFINNLVKLNCVWTSEWGNVIGQSCTV
jgi:hypothetical protein